MSLTPEAIHDFDLVDGMDGGREPAMDAEYAVIDYD
jgi:hypothetical protein